MRCYNCTLFQWWSRAVQGVSSQDSNLQHRLPLQRTMESVRELPTINQPSQECASGWRRFVSPTESKKLKSQPALRLVHSKTNHLAVNYFLPAFTNAASIPAARELLCDPPVFLLTLLFGSRASSRAVAFFAPSSPTSISSFQHLSSA
jgi:hypothetical protein